MFRSPSRSALRTNRTASLVAAIMVVALLSSTSAQSEPAQSVPGSLQPDVQRALSYVVPETTCTAPDIRRSNPSGGTFERIERMNKRYVKCLEQYQRSLFDDFVFLRESVRHGVTMPQAETIAGNMKKVADAIKSLQSKGVVIAQDQARIISTGLSGNRQMPGAENH